MHGVELENGHVWDRLRLNEIGPDVWECDECLTIQVEDSCGILDSNGRDLRALIANLVRLVNQAPEALLHGTNDTIADWMTDARLATR